MKVQVIKTGDYVEVTDAASAGVENGEQGIVIDAENQSSLELVFPARTDLWGTDDKKSLGNYGWYVMAKYVKLLYRPRVK